MTKYFTGTATESVGTHITALCPAFDTRIPVLREVGVTTGADAQDLYVCSALAVFETSRYTQDGATTTEVFDVSPGGTELSEDDYIVAINDQGRFEILRVQSVSGNTITWQSGPAQDLPIRTLMYSFYQPSDSGLSKFPPLPKTATQPAVTVPANGSYEYKLNLQAGRDTQIDGVTTAVRAEGTPMLVILENKDSQSTLNFCAFEWVDRSEDAALRIAADMAEASSGAGKTGGDPVEEGD